MTTAGVGSGYALAPEILTGSSTYTASSDIYAFGVLLSELDTLRSPFVDQRDAMGTPVPEIVILQRLTDGTLQPAFSSSCPVEIREIAMRCMALRSEDRPAAVEVAYVLHRLLR